MFADGLFTNKSNMIKRIAVFLVLMLFIFYLFYHFLESYFFTIKTTDAVYASLDITDEFTAYTFRDETVFYSQFGGAFDYSVNDGEFVSLDTELVDCYENSTEIDVLAMREELTEQIAMLNESNSNNSFTASDIDETQSNATRAYTEMLKAATLGNMESTQQYASNLLTALNKLSVYEDYSNNFNDEIDALNEQLAGLDTYFTGRYETLSTDKTGYYFYDTDGYESLFTSNINGNSRADILTVNEFYTLTENMQPQSAPDGEYAAGKLVNSYNWFIGVPIARDSVGAYFTGQLYDISYDDYNVSIPMELSRIIMDEGDDRAVLLFVSSNMPTGFTYPRSAKISLVRKEYSGLRVPIDLVVKVDGFYGVYTVEKLTVEFRKVNIIYKEYGYYIVSEYDTSDERYIDYLEHNDALITKGYNLFEGKVVGE